MTFKKERKKYNKENALPKSCIIMVWAILQSDVCNPRLPPPESIFSKVHSQISVKEMVLKNSLNTFRPKSVVLRKKCNGKYASEPCVQILLQRKIKTLIR